MSFVAVDLKIVIMIDNYASQNMLSFDRKSLLILQKKNQEIN